MAGWDTKPVNGNEYTVIVGSTTGTYNMNYVGTWMEFKVIQDSTDVANNQSRVDIKMYSQVLTGGSGSGMANYAAGDWGYAGWDNGNRTTYNTAYNFNNFALNKFFDGIITIPHNADGTKTITLQAGFSLPSSSISGGSASTVLALPTIAKGTTLTNITNRYYGYPATFELSRKASNLWEQIWIEYGGYSYHVVNNGANPNFQYTIPRETTPNTASPSTSYWTVTIYTYNGSTLVDTKFYSGWDWQINPSDTSYKPTFTTPSLGIYNDVIGAFGGYVAVAGYSKLQLSATSAQITTKYNATIAARTVTFSGGGGTISDVNASTYTSNKYTSAGDYTCTYTVTDSRGFSETWTSSPVNFKSYSAPTLNVSECYRGDSSQNASDSGTYAWGTATYSICTLAGSDNINRNSVSSFTAQVTGFSVVNLTSGVRALLASGLSLSSVYTVTFSVTDITGHTATETRTIPSEDVPLVIREGGKGVGIGAYCEGEGLISVGYQFSGAIKSKGNRIFGTCNKIDWLSIEQGALSVGDGTEIANTGQFRSGFCAVDGSTTYTVSMGTTGLRYQYVYEFNSSKAFIGATALNFTNVSTFTTNASTKYVRFMGDKYGSVVVPSDVLNPQLEEGPYASPYVPYAMDNVELTDAVRPQVIEAVLLANTSATLDYTGVYITLPEGWWAIDAFAMYNYSAPLKLALYQYQNGFNNLLSVTEIQNGMASQYLHTSCVLNNEQTNDIRVYAQHASAESNVIRIRARKLV